MRISEMTDEVLDTMTDQLLSEVLTLDLEKELERFKGTPEYIEAQKNTRDSVIEGEESNWKYPAKALRWYGDDEAHKFLDRIDQIVLRRTARILEDATEAFRRAETFADQFGYTGRPTAELTIGDMDYPAATVYLNTGHGGWCSSAC